MTDRTPQPDTVSLAGGERAHDVASPVGRLVPVIGLWGGGAALLAIAIAWSRGVSDSAAIGAVTVFAAAAAGVLLLLKLAPRPIAKWAFPVLGAQMVRTMLAPALGLAVYFLTVPMMQTEPKAFWLTLLAVSAAMLVGETIAVSNMFGSASRSSQGDTNAGREAVA